MENYIKRCQIILSVWQQELRLEYIEGVGLKCSDCNHGYSNVYIKCSYFCHRIRQSANTQDVQIQNELSFEEGSLVSRFEFHYFAKYCFRARVAINNGNGSMVVWLRFHHRHFSVSTTKPTYYHLRQNLLLSVFACSNSLSLSKQVGRQPEEKDKIRS